jgi:hypothetical protein
MKLTYTAVLIVLNKLMTVISDEISENFILINRGSSISEKKSIFKGYISIT